MENRDSVIRKVTTFVNYHYAGDWRKAFDVRDTDGDGKISTDELETLLDAAKVGFGLTRWKIAESILAELDADRDGFVQWPEFQAVFSGAAAAPFVPNNSAESLMLAYAEGRAYAKALTKNDPAAKSNPYPNGCAQWNEFERGYGDARGY